MLIEMRKKIDLTGQVFGRLTVIRYACFKNRSTYWVCKCICGTENMVAAHNLRNGRTLSCGCLNRERLTIHGEYGTPEYKAWRGMMNRCYWDKKSKNVKRYQERGITVCDEWRNSFLAFLRDVGRKPSPAMTLERIDNDKGYYLGNVMWATEHEQALNRRIYETNISGITGVCFDNRRQNWRAYIVVYGKQIGLGSFPSKEEAVTARKHGEEKYFKPIMMAKYERFVGMKAGCAK